MFKIAVFVPNSLIYAAVCLLLISACRTGGWGVHAVLCETINQMQLKCISGELLRQHKHYYIYICPLPVVSAAQQLSNEISDSV